MREAAGLETPGARRPVMTPLRPVSPPVKPPAHEPQATKESAPKIIKFEEHREQVRPQISKEPAGDSRTPSKDVPPKSTPSDLIDRMILEQEREEDETMRTGKRDSSSIKPESDEANI